LRIQVVLSGLIACCLFSLPLSFAQTSNQTEDTTGAQPSASTVSDASESDTAGTVADTTPSVDPQCCSKAGGGTTGRAKPSIGGATTTTPYTFPTGREMNIYWLKNTLGPKAFVGAAFTAGWNQWVTDSPKEWAKDATGYGQRFGSSFLDNSINTTSLVWVSRAMHQDPRYRRCDCTGFWPRTKHAFVLSVMAYNRNGDLTFAPQKIGAPYTGPLVSRNTIYPDRFGTSKAFSGGAYYMVGSVVWNWVREFIWNM
jgi:hypothetical protein